MCLNPMDMYKTPPKRHHPAQRLLACALLAWTWAAHAVGNEDPAPSATAPAYLVELQEQADLVHLHDDPYWHILLHYEQGMFGIRSRVDDPDFFCSPHGKTHPREELQATLSAFFQEPTEQDVDHPVCRWIGRYTWLRDVLGINPTRLPLGECETYQRVFNEINPSSATLIFPSAHMNRPASMFGHTAIVFETAEKNRLLARAVSYAATTTEGFGPFFAFSGIMGLYKGYYSIDPYADKVEEYNDLSQRDVWEYELDFSTEEIDRMMRHVWELQKTYSRYFFFTENCAFNLLYLIEAGRPSLDLSSRFGWWVIPIDTVKAVNEAGVIREVAYRPSKTTTLQHLADQLTKEHVDLALSLANGNLSPDQPWPEGAGTEQQIIMLDLAAEYCQYTYAKRDLDQAHYRERFLSLLRARSQLGTRPVDTYSASRPVNPEQGHDAGRVAFGGGWMESDWFLSLQWRPAHHELSDTLHGFDLGSHLQFAPLQGRYLLEEDRFELERADLIDIFSIAPRDRLFQPKSWKLRGGVRQVKADGIEDNLLGYVSTGTGRAYRVPGGGLVGGMLETDILAGGRLDHSYAAGLGFSLTWQTTSVGPWHAVLHARAMPYLLGQDFFSYRVTCSQNLAVGRNQSLFLNLSHEVNDHNAVQQAELACRFYF